AGPPAATKGGKVHPRLAVGCSSISAFTKNDPELVFQVITKTLNQANMRESASLATPTRLSVTRDPDVMQKFRFIKAAADNVQAGAPLLPRKPPVSGGMLQTTQMLQKGLTGGLTLPPALKRAPKVMHGPIAGKG